MTDFTRALKTAEIYVDGRKVGNLDDAYLFFKLLEPEERQGLRKALERGTQFRGHSVAFALAGEKLPFSEIAPEGPIPAAIPRKRGEPLIRGHVVHALGVVGR